MTAKTARCVDVLLEDYALDYLPSFVPLPCHWKQVDRFCYGCSLITFKSCRMDTFFLHFTVLH